MKVVYHQNIQELEKIYRKYLIKVWIIIFYDKYHTFSLPINIL